jgi:hypothetical protein
MFFWVARGILDFGWKVCSLISESGGESSLLRPAKPISLLREEIRDPLRVSSDNGARRRLDGVYVKGRSSGFKDGLYSKPREKGDKANKFRPRVRQSGIVKLICNPLCAPNASGADHKGCFILSCASVSSCKRLTKDLHNAPSGRCCRI